MHKRIGLVLDDWDTVGNVGRVCCGRFDFDAGGCRDSIRQERQGEIMFGHQVRNTVGSLSLSLLGGGYKKKKILELATKYARVRELGWETYYREMSGLLR